MKQKRDKIKNQSQFIHSSIIKLCDPPRPLRLCGKNTPSTTDFRGDLQKLVSELKLRRGDCIE
jgi:hypothetical protein